MPLEDADERLKKPFRDYVKQKGVGKGFTDWALLIANANQLNFVVTHPDAHLRNLETVFLSLSIILQVNMTYSILYGSSSAGLVLEFEMSVHQKSTTNNLSKSQFKKIK